MHPSQTPHTLQHWRDPVIITVDTVTQRAEVALELEQTTLKAQCVIIQPHGTRRLAG
jgi:hypothetical protein